MTERALKPGWTRVKFGDVVRLGKDRCADPAAEGIERYVRWLNVILGIALVIVFLGACAAQPTSAPTATFAPTATITPTAPSTSTSTPVISPTGVLFIGNSLTFFNDMPDMFAELARAGDYPVHVDMSARNAGTLSEHSRAPATLGKIRRGGWDFVVLQEQSALPANVAQRQELVYPAARLLDAEIAQTGARAVFYMTWGHRDGFPDEGHADFAAMQTELATGYTAIADELDAELAPVGLAWQMALAQDPHLDLWKADGMHPTRTGSYLIACVFYAVIFEENPQGLAYYGGLPEEQAQFLQRVAAATVLNERER